MLQSPPRFQAKDIPLLRPVVVKGMDSAAAGLSELLGTEIKIQNLRLKLLPLTEVVSSLGPPDDVVTGIYLAMCGEIEGHITILFPEREALRLVDMLMGLPEGSSTILDDMAISALGELGNITGSLFITALADTLSLSLRPSPPAVVQDMCGAILDIAIIDMAQEADETILIEASFSRGTRNANGFFLIMPSPSSLVAIREKLTP